MRGVAFPRRLRAFLALAVIVLGLAGCGDEPTTPQLTSGTIRTLVVATVPEATVPPDPAVVAQAAALAGRVAAVQAAVDGGAAARLVAAVAALRSGRSGARDPVVGRAWDAGLAGAEALAAYSAQLERRPSAAARAVYLCDMPTARAANARLASLGAAFRLSAAGVTERLGVSLPFAAIDGPVALTPAAALASSAWGCVVALRPLVHALNQAKRPASIVREAKLIERIYDRLAKGLDRGPRVGSAKERRAVAEVQRWAAIESQLMRLVIRSWQRHDVAQHAFQVLVRRETAVGRRLVAALRSVGVDARLR